MKKISYLLPLFFAIALALGFYLGKKNTTPIFDENAKSEGIDYNSKRKLFSVLKEIENNYVDSISDKELTDKTIEQLLANLDPHSVYIPYQKNNREEENLKGEFAGVGVKFIILNDTLHVTNVIENGPSYRAGLKNGDIVLAVDTTPVAGVDLQNEQVMSLLKGRPNTTVTLKLLRQGKEISKTIKRGIIPIKSVTAAFMLNKNTGYIKLVRFSETSAQEFFFASQKLLKQGMKKLVFDLRGNGGGYLQIAEQIADEFLEEGKTIVFTKEKGDKKNYTYSSSKGQLKNITLAVLIDSESASASEIVAGALQDNDRGTVFGRRSFGKGLVQKPVILPDSSQIRITIARYYTPTGRSIQKPYELGNSHDYMMELYDRDRNGELFEVDSSVFIDSLKYITEGGKAVYGGGGIMPDIFIPFDTVGYSMYYRKIAYSRILTEYSIKYLAAHRNTLAKKSLNHYMQNFNISNEMFSEFVAFAKERGVTGTSSEINNSKKRLFERIKEEIASGIWDEEGREYIISRSNNDLKVLLENL
jgi:carboxyl-terminal processing protease